MLSLASGHDPEYLTATVGAGREGYYTGAVAEGEPPGVWWGAGAAELGLSGQVDAEVMEALYKHLVDPRDPMSGQKESWEQAATVGEPHRRFRTAREIYDEWIKAEERAGERITPEVDKQYWLQALRWERQPVAFVDATFSAPKSVSLLGVSFERAAHDARAAGDLDTAAVMDTYRRSVEAAVLAGATAALEYLQDRAGYCRVGHHGGGAERWDDAHAFVVAQFLQHDSRARDPQLHVHQAILNRALGADGQWRALDTMAIRSWRAAAGAVAERVMEAHLSESVGVAFEWRLDGKAREVLGVDRGLCEVFSKRSAQINRKMQPLVEEYVARHGREPSQLMMHRIRQATTLSTRAPKSHRGETTAERLDRIEAEAGQVVASLGQVAAEALAAGHKAGQRAEWSADEALAKAAAVMADRGRATEADAVRAVSDALPGDLRMLPDEVRGLVDQLAGRLLDEHLVNLRAPESAEGLPRDRVRADGSSQYQSPRAARVAHPGTLAAQHALREAAAAADGVEALDARLVGEVIRAYAQLGIELGADQAGALAGITGSAAGIEVLCAPAGAGKSVVVGALAQVWATGGRRMAGLTTSENAADVLRGEGVTARNVAQWLGTQDRLATGRGLDGDQAFAMGAGDLVVLDEANMTGATDLAAVTEWCQRAGAKLVLVGDPQQLDAVDGGGVLADLAGRAPSHELTEVRRFAQDWERGASLRLREGDPAAVLEYTKHGRVQAGGTMGATETKAIHAYLSDVLGGRESLLLVGSNEAAARMSEQVRDRLIELGQLAEGPVVELGRQGTVAGVGDLVEGRRNAWELSNSPGDGQAPVNRRTYRVTEVHSDGGLSVTPTLGGEPLVLPPGYVATDLSLGYASTVHAAEGRTVRRCHSVIGPGTDAAGAYVALTRGWEHNTAWCVTRTEVNDAPTGETAHTKQRSAEAVLAEVIDRSEGEAEVGLSDLAYAEAQAELASSTKTSLDRLVDQIEGHTTRRTASLLDQLARQGLLSAEQRAALGADGLGTHTLGAVLRDAEIAGHDPARVLREAAAGRELTGATSIGAVLRARIRTGHTTSSPSITSYTDLIPRDLPGERRAALLRYAWAADERRRTLGAELVSNPPRWAREHLGPVPDGLLERAEWEHRAGWIAAHHERADQTDDTAPLGSAPPKAQPERHAIWRAAHTALGSPDAGDEQADMSEAQLREAVDAYDHAQAWAPEYVGDELATAWHAAGTATADAVLQEHYANASNDPDRATALRTDAARARADAQALQARTAELEAKDRDRGRWYAESAEARERAYHARAALQVRGAGPAQTALAKPEPEHAAQQAHVAVEQLTAQRQAHEATEARLAQLARWHTEDTTSQQQAGDDDQLAAL